MWPWSKIKELENEKKANQDTMMYLVNANLDLNQQIREMADDIRIMDQLVYKITQHADGTWQSVRHEFSLLKAATEKRMRDESNRITDIMRKELIHTYALRLANKERAE